MNQLKRRRSKASVALPSIIFTISNFNPSSSFAEEIFNPAFLTDGNTSGVVISDISKFNTLQYQPPSIYRVEVIVNGESFSTKDVDFIEKEDENGKLGLFPCFDIETIESFGINLDKQLVSENPKCIDFFSVIPGSTSNFAFEKQKLNLTFPQIAIRNNVRGYIPPEKWDDGINALFSNYMISAYNDSNRDSKNLFLSLNSGFNIGAWQFRNDTTYNYSGQADSSQSEWNHINTYVKKNIIPLKSKLILGDNNTNNDIFDSFGFRGLSLSSAEEMYPDSQQGYAPTIRGIAKTNANVVIKQNGYAIYQITVPPGPFVIEDLNPTSVSGDLLVEVNENDGSVQNFIIPYSTLPVLQREGRTKYDVIAGKYRSGSNQANQLKFFQGSAAYGLPLGISVYGGSQLSSDYQSALLGVGRNLGQYGALSFDVTHANSTLANGSDHSGQSLRFLYAKSLLRTGTTFRLLGYRYSTEGFYTFNEVANSNWSINKDEPPQINNEVVIGTNFSRKGRFDASISHAFSDNKGSLFISGTEQRYWGTSDKNRWLQAGYSTFYKGVNLSLSLSHFKYDVVKQKDTLISAGISFSLDSLFRKNNDTRAFNNAYATTSAIHSSENGTAIQSGLSGTLLKDQNLAYSVLLGNQSEQGGSGSLFLDYKGRYGNVGGGYSYNDDSSLISLNASGSALIHRDGVTLGQRLNETSILVDAEGASGVSIDNYVGLKTDWRGYALLPYASAYRENRVSLNPNSFSDNLEIEKNVDVVVPANGAIVRAKFKASLGFRALITLKQGDNFIPYASTVTEANSGTSGIVGSDGAVYLTGLPERGTLNVVWSNKAEDQCSIDYNMAEIDTTVQSVVQFDLTCQ